MSPKAPRPDNLPFSLARMAVCFRRFGDQTLGAVGMARLAPGLPSVLHALENLGTCTIGQLVEATHFPNGTLTGLLDTLEVQGLVSRIANPKDGRSRLLKLTAKGRKTCIKLHKRHELSLAVLDKALGKRDSATLARLLDKASEALRAYEAPMRTGKQGRTSTRQPTPAQ